MAGPVTAVYWIRRAAALAGNEKTGNAVGTILTAFLLPFILIIVCLCGMMDAAADHNRAAVEWCFGDGAIPAAVPEEYAGHITQMRACFAVLDGAVGKLNAELEEGSVPLRANRVKADFFALNFGAPDLTLRQGQAESFAGCYVSEAVRIRTVEVPNPEYDPPEDEEELEDYDVPKTIEVEQEYMVTVGTVLLARYGHASYGNYVVVGHGGGVTTLYAHCSALNVTVGQAVSAGDVVAFVGSTGDSTGDHLHLEVNDNGTLKNPREYLP